jgi:peptidyl-prolyl cis-trans isomerase D
MLRTMRNDFKKYSWTLWLVIIAFVGGFVAIDAFRGEKALDKTGLIFANGKVIIKGDVFSLKLHRILELYKNQFKNNFNKSLITQLRLPEQTLRGMLGEAIVKMEADKLDISVSDKEVEDKIVNNPQFQQDGKFIGVEAYEQFIRYRYQSSVTEFENEVRSAVLQEKLQELVTGSLIIDEAALRAEFKKDKDKADLDMITFKPDRIKQEIKVEDKEISEYYEKHKEDFKSDEKRAGYVIAFKFDDYKKEVSVSENEIFDFFNKNRADFVIPGKTKVSRIFLKYDANNREEILNKASALQKDLSKDNFAEKSKTSSDDPKAQTGGDYGYTEWRNFTNQENSIIESMKVNQVSPVVDTQRGFSILLVSEKVEDVAPEFNAVKARIKDSIEQERLNKKVEEKVQAVYKKLEKAENIKAKAAEAGVTAFETELVANGQGIKNLDEMGSISRKLFSLKAKEVSMVAFDKGAVIVQLSRIEKQVVEPLEKVKDKVKDKVVLTKKINLLKEEAAAVTIELKKISDPKLVEEFLKGKNLTSQAVTYNRGNRLSGLPIKKGLDDILFSFDLNVFSSPIEFDSEVAVVKLKSKTITSPADFEKERAAFYDQKIKELHSNFFESYIENRMEAYKITSNNDLLQEITENIVSRYR